MTGNVIHLVYFHHITSNYISHPVTNKIMIITTVSLAKFETKQTCVDLLLINTWKSLVLWFSVNNHSFEDYSTEL